MHFYIPSAGKPGFLKLGAVALAALAFSHANAAPPAGQLLASQCAQCHGTNGNGYESIAGKGFSDLYGDLIEMKNRPVETIMDRQARGYTDDQLRMISDYFSRLPSSGSDD
jgi:sulfide dehydrogenase cytochrome subunit